MRLLVSFLLFAFVLCKVNAQNPAWEAYKLQYGYVFDSVEEDQKREAIWADSLNKLVSNQKKFAVGGEIPSFKLGQNKFSLYTYDEKVSKFTGLTREAREHRRRMFDVKQAGKTSKRPTTTRRVTTTIRPTTSRRPTTTRMPTTTRRLTTTVQINTNSSVDWRNTPLVGPVKNQGSCGSCWAFSALDALEGAIGKKYNKYERLSEQQIVDCSTTNGGCNGGDPQWVYTDVLSKFPSRGIYTNAVYPYTGVDGTCQNKGTTYGAVMTNWIIGEGQAIGTYGTPAGNEAWLEYAVTNMGPVSVCLYVSNNFFSYTSGVYTESTCTQTVWNSMNHCVSVVGFGTDSASSKKYWIVRNSWGSSWGKAGYMYLEKNKGNQLCISSEAYVPVVQ